MGAFLEEERARQTAFKSASRYLLDRACADGIYRGKPRPFCLPEDCSEENLYAEIRQKALDYFAACGIKWHDGHQGKSSNHLCDSQVCCVNFLLPFADKSGYSGRSSSSGISPSPDRPTHRG